MNGDAETHCCKSSGDCSPSESSIKRGDLNWPRRLDLRLTTGGEEALRVSQHWARGRNERIVIKKKTYGSSRSEGASVSESLVTRWALELARVVRLGAAVDPSDCAGRVPFAMGLGFGLVLGLPNVSAAGVRGMAAERRARGVAVSRRSGVSGFRLRVTGILWMAESAWLNDTVSLMQNAT